MALTTFTAMQAQDDEVPNSSSSKMFVNMNFSGRAGTSMYKQTVNSNGYKFKDVALTGGAAELEFTLRGFRYQLEFDYQQGDMSDVTANVEGKPEFKYDQNKFAEDLKIMTGIFYMGTTIFPCKRFQIPIYAVPATATSCRPTRRRRTTLKVSRRATRWNSSTTTTPPKWASRSCWDALEATNNNTQKR